MSKIQRQDIKTEAELAGLGAPPSSLPGDDQIYVAANSINKTLRQAILDGDIGGGAGGINYILNGDALANTNGWATYADAAQSRPVDGTGGSPNVTWTRSTTTPLRGVAEFNFTKDAVNRQGQGISYAFTIDRADQAKPLQISFDWKLVSGTFAGSTAPATDSDLIVYIYDVTNGVLIEPAGRLLEPAVTGQQYRYRGTFQSSPNSTSYRLIFHVATTTTQAFTLGFDDIRVGPQVVSNGAVVTDWQSYTPSTVPANGASTARWRRVGDSMEIEYGFNATATVSQQIIFSIPAGYSIDTAKLFASGGVGRVIGPASHFITSLGVILTATMNVVSATTLQITAQTRASTNTHDLLGTISITNNDSFTGKALIPIAGWSSNVQMSNDTDTRVVALAARQLSPISVTANNPIPYSAVDFDTHGGFNNPTAGRYRIPVSGIYRLSVTGIITSATQAELELWVNGVNTLDFTSVASNATRWDSGSITRQLNAGDIIDVRPNSTATVASYFFVERISGPSQIAASEPVNASAVSTAAQSIATATDTILNLTAKDYDSHNALTIGASARFTAPARGLYNVAAMIRFNTGQSFTSSNIISILLYKNGVIYKQMANFLVEATNASAGYIPITGSADAPLNAGEYIEVRVFQNSGGTRNLEANGSTNWVAIKKVD